MDAALIIEMGHADKYRPLIVVSCKKETQVKRLMKRNGLSETDALARINSQMTSEKKMKYADFFLDTNGTLEESEKQMISIINQLTKAKT